MSALVIASIYLCSCDPSATQDKISSLYIMDLTKRSGEAIYEHKFKRNLGDMLASPISFDGYIVINSHDVDISRLPEWSDVRSLTLQRRKPVAVIQKRGWPCGFVNLFHLRRYFVTDKGTLSADDTEDLIDFLAGHTQPVRCVSLQGTQSLNEPQPHVDCICSRCNDARCEYLVSKL